MNVQRVTDEHLELFYQVVEEKQKMNERIKQLAEQAGYTEAYYDGDYGPFVPEEFNKEKFAELIIKECANFVENIFDDDGGHAPCEDYAKGIKQHFGVDL